MRSRVGQTLTRNRANSETRFSACPWRPPGAQVTNPGHAHVAIAEQQGGIAMNTVSYEFSEQTPLSTVAGTLLGTSAAMQEVFRLIERVGPSEACVLLTGESGTGKELAARSIHEYSPRCGGPFVAIHCGAMSAGLSNSKVFERAQGGTLLLDEVTEMPLDMQTRLLRVLETQKCDRVGASKEYTHDVRVI